MSQKQFINYQADILSFPIGEAHLGILNSGRYSGFSAIATNGTPTGGSIPLKIIHTGGVQILGKSQVELDPSIGVMVSTQGIIIHEGSDVSITISDNSGGGQKKYCLVYMEHEYQDGVEGDNPAFYGVINGAAGGGVPALTNAYKRTVVGVIELAPGATTIAGCKYHPRMAENVIGDTKVLQKLFGPNVNLLVDDMGVIPTTGIIGQRKFTHKYYLADDISITEALDILDNAIHAAENVTEEVGLRALDDDGWGDLSDVTKNDVTINHHGLMPKLCGDESKTLNGKGEWVGLGGALLIANDLSDLHDKGKALENLGLISYAKMVEKHFYDSGWKSMKRGAAAMTSNFDVKIRRIGSMMTIQGTFMGYAGYIYNGSSIAYIDALDLAESTALMVGPTTRIYIPGFININGNYSNNGFFASVPVTTELDPAIYVKIESVAADLANLKLNFNITFPVDLVIPPIV